MPWSLVSPVTTMVGYRSAQVGWQQWQIGARIGLDWGMGNLDSSCMNRTWVHLGPDTSSVAFLTYASIKAGIDLSKPTRDHGMAAYLRLPTSLIPSQPKRCSGDCLSGATPCRPAKDRIGQLVCPFPHLFTKRHMLWFHVQPYCTMHKKSGYWDVCQSLAKLSIGLHVSAGPSVCVIPGWVAVTGLVPNAWSGHKQGMWRKDSTGLCPKAPSTLTLVLADAANQKRQRRESRTVLSPTFPDQHCFCSSAWLKCEPHTPSMNSHLAPCLA